MAATYLNVPFREKDEAKALGARWDPARRCWYVPDGVDPAGFTRWFSADGAVPAKPVRVATDIPVPMMSAAASTSIFDPVPAVVRTGTALTSGEDIAIRDPGDALAYGTPRGVPLSRLLNQVGQVVAERFGEPVWVTVEVVRASTAGQGHVYLEVSERDPQGQVIAKAQAAIWSRTARAILPPFEKATGAVLGAGIKLLIRVRPVFKAQYGFSLDIDAIDPAYTLGDLAAKKQEIRDRLKREGLFDRNRQLPPPWDFNRVLVVAPTGAAGLGDFREEADRLQRHRLCVFVYAHSRFQGAEAPAEILAAARDLVERHPQADALIIIRGGGAVNDLAWLDDYALARFICECAMPVFTGIGHERDSTMLDEVAQRRFDTPSKVVLGIEQRIVQRSREAGEAMGLIAAAASDAIAVARLRTDRGFADVREAAGTSIHRSRQGAERLLSRIRLDADRHRQQARASTRAALVGVTGGARQAIADARRTLPRLRTDVLTDSRDALHAATTRIDDTIRSVARDARRQITEAGRMTEALVREVAGQGPGKTLGRGFALVRDADGRPLTSAARSVAAGLLQIEFQDGRLSADVHPRSLKPTGPDTGAETSAEPAP